MKEKDAYLIIFSNEKGRRGSINEGKNKLGWKESVRYVFTRKKNSYNDFRILLSS